MIFNDTGHLAVMPTQHSGVRDIAVGGPGFESPAITGTEAPMCRDARFRTRSFRTR